MDFDLSGQEAGKEVRLWIPYPLSDADQLITDINPEQVRVTEIEERAYTVYQLHVAPDDVGKVIGRGGRIANALRVLIRTASARHNRRAILEIV